MTPLERKLAAFDEWAPTSLRWAIDTLRTDGDAVIAVARARLITGHYVYGDKMMFEFSNGRLQKEIIEELADAVNYGHVKLSREGQA